jgi:hypothetical protein
LSADILDQRRRLFHADTQPLQSDIHLDDNLSRASNRASHRHRGVELTDRKHQAESTAERCRLRTREHSPIQEYRSVDAGAADPKRVFRIAQSEPISAARDDGFGHPRQSKSVSICLDCAVDLRVRSHFVPKCPHVVRDGVEIRLNRIGTVAPRPALNPAGLG